MTKHNLDPIKVGDIVDDLECLEILPDDRKHHKPVRLRCTVCGREKTLYLSSIRRHAGTTHKACGYMEKTLNHRFYVIWQRMRQRTSETDKNPKNSCYRENGIKSDKFAYFIDFFDSMYESYCKHVEQFGEHETTLDRIDSSKDYYPENCRWATYAEQGDNNSVVRTVEFTSPDGEHKIVRNYRKFCLEHGLAPSAICRVLRGQQGAHKGWTAKYID